MARIIHSRIQHGVGQGSFHSASVEIKLRDGSQHRFDYVYDCGGLDGFHKSAGLKRSLRRLDLEIRPRSVGLTVIDALVLSHFDQDHMNGAQDLIANHRVERIYMPYLSPVELAFVIASQANSLTDSVMRELHAVANGASTLFEIPVTMVKRGVVDVDQARNLESRRPQQIDEESQQIGAASSIGPAESMTVTVDGINIAPGREITDSDDLRVSANGAIAWQLRFWNQELEDELVFYVACLLDAVGFPVESLDDPNGIATILRWLQHAQNRRAAESAYRQAIEIYRPSWAYEASGRRLPNFISLAMFSGPWSRAPRANSDFDYRSIGDLHDLAPWHWRRNYQYFRSDREVRDIGWLGTGDALLGEPTVWTDFEQHFKFELPRVCTILVPHHGAAPLGGPRFFNEKLIHHPGVASVISVGKFNSYGHPRPSVLKQIAAAGGYLVIVSDDDWLGFQEIVFER